MRKGTVIVGALSHKNLNHVFEEFEPVTENDVDNWNELVEKGYIKPDKSTLAAESKGKKEVEEKAKTEKESTEVKDKKEVEEKAKANKK